MADDKKTLEMRVAELEDKLAQVHITEDEMATYNKVAAKLGGGATASSQPCIASQAQQPCVAQPQQQCIVQQPCVLQCIQHCIIYKCIRTPIINNPIYWHDCIPQCAPCAAGGTGGTGGGGFGGLGGG